MVYDDNATILTASVDNSLVGQSFFNNRTQDFFNHNKILNNLIESLLNGKESYARYDYGPGEMLTTQSPVHINGKVKYSIQLSSPTKEIISQLEDALFSETLKMISLLTGSFVAIVVLILYLIKWNRSLEKEVRIKSQELFEAERIQKILEESSEGIKRYLNQVKETIRQEKIKRSFSNDI